jgi:signal transduction histidine kinase
MRCLWSRCFWTRSLVGQLIGFMLLALFVSQTISFFIYWDERGQALRQAAKEEFLVRSASVAQLLETTPASYHPEILRAVATNYSRFWLSTERPDDVTAWKEEAWYRLALPLPRYGEPEREPGSLPDARAAAKEASLVTTPAYASEFNTWDILPAKAWSLDRPAHFVRLDHTYGAGLTVRLQGGTWLNAAFAKAAYGSIWTSQSTVSLAITAVALSLIAILVARRVARPMRRLAFAAEAFGRGEEIARLPEEGPTDIRRTAEAFNRMQERLHRFVKDRTGMLAAIGHDLRTPITSLRLRAEFVTDAEMREKILATLDEMQAMTEATLAFAREEATGEPTRVIDLAALAESVCNDLADLGWDVTFAESGKVPYRCRPAAIRRALRNLIENAVRYGGCARVSLALSKDSFEISIDDDGPGIPEEEFERVFAPFFRLEGSRSRTTGGVGLGLSIARTIVRGHGGDIELVNLRGGGLRAVIRLPQVPAVR